MKDADIVRALGVSICTVELKKDPQTAVHDLPPQRKPTGKIDGKTEAHPVAAACGVPPEGRSRRTLRLLGDHLVTLGLVDSVSPQTIGRVLQKTS